MKKLKTTMFAFILISFIIFFPKITWAAKGNVVTIKDGTATYHFLEVETGQWMQSDSDVVSSGYHVVSNYEYDSSKTCTTTAPTLSNYQSLLGSCAILKNQTKYSGTTTLYPEDVKNYSNGIMSSRSIYLRNANLNITEARIYYYNNDGVITSYSRYYNGTTLNPVLVSYNKIYKVTRDNNNQVTGIYNYENSLLWNEKAATVPTSYAIYNYYSNGVMKQRNQYYKSVKYNTFYKKTYLTYSSNGIKKAYVLYNLNYQGKTTSKYTYYYNRNGDLKSNGYDKAYRYKSTYSNGKMTSTYKYQYTSTGKLIRI